MLLREIHSLIRTVIRYGIILIFIDNFRLTQLHNQLLKPTGKRRNRRRIPSQFLLFLNLLSGLLNIILLLEFPQQRIIRNRRLLLLLLPRLQLSNLKRRFNINIRSNSEVSIPNNSHWLPCRCLHTFYHTTLKPQER